MLRPTLALLALTIWIAPVLANAQNDLTTELTHEELERNVVTYAVLGDRQAQWLVGQLYRTDWGDIDSKFKPLNYPIATRWYLVSALQGHAEAQAQLGTSYALGRGVLKDHVQAYKWFSLAAIGLSGEAFENVSIASNLLAAEFSSSQLTDAKQLAKEWRPVTFVEAREALVEEFYPRNANCGDAWGEMIALLFDVKCLPGRE